MSIQQYVQDILRIEITILSSGDASSRVVVLMVSSIEGETNRPGGTPRNMKIKPTSAFYY